MKPRALVFVVAILAVCCLVSGGLSLRNNRTAGRTLPSFSPDSLEELANRFTLPLKVEEIIDDDPGDDCYLSEKVFVVPDGAVCEFTIVASKSTTRRLELLLRQGETLVVELEQEDALIVEATLQPETVSTPTPLDVFRNLDEESATLTIRGCEPAPRQEGQEGAPAPCQAAIQ